MTVYKAFLLKKNCALKDVEDKQKKAITMNKPSTAANAKDISSSISGTRSISSLFERTDTSAKYSYNDVRQKKITEDIALLIATTTLPVSVVSAPCFKKLVSDLNPHARTPGPDKTRKEINQLWDRVRGALKNAIEIARKVQVTTDIWTSKNLVASYLGLTIHFFNPKTRRRNAFTIACREFPNPHTGEMIAQKLVEICREFGMEKKTEFINCDNGSNMVASFRFMQNVDDDSTVDAFDETEEETEEEFLIDDDESIDPPPLFSDSEDSMEVSTLAADRDQEDEAEMQVEEEEIAAEIADHTERDLAIDVELEVSGFKRLGCFSHTLQLPINKVNKVKNQIFGRVLQKTKKFVVKYRTSSKAKYILKKTSFKKRLVGFVKTRWHSDLEMSKSVVEAAEKEDKPLSKLTEAMNWPLEITVGDVRMLKNYNTLMEPFAVKTNLLGGEKYSTIQLVLPTLLELMNHLDDFGAKTGGGVLRYCKRLKSEMEHYFRHVLDPKSEVFNPVYYLATFLDPIFSQVLTADQNKTAVELLKQKIKEEMSKNNEDWRNIVDNPGEGDVSKKTLFKGFKHISSLLANAQSSDKASSTPLSRDLELFKAEIHRVSLSRIARINDLPDASTVVVGDLDDLVVDDTPAEEEESPIDDPLDYWVENESKYETILPLIAQDILCITATSTPSERLFSVSGLLSSGVMSNISPANLEKRVLIKVNIVPEDI